MGNFFLPVMNVLGMRAVATKTPFSEIECFFAITANERLNSCHLGGVVMPLLSFYILLECNVIAKNLKLAISAVRFAFELVMDLAMMA